MSARASMLAALLLGPTACGLAGRSAAPSPRSLGDAVASDPVPDDGDGEASLSEEGSGVIVPWATRRLPAPAGVARLAGSPLPPGLRGPLWLSHDEHGEPLVMLCWKDQIGNAHAEWFIVSRMEFTETA